MVAQLAKAADSECILFPLAVVTDVAIKPSLAHPDRASAFQADDAGSIPAARSNIWNTPYSDGTDVFFYYVGVDC